MTKNVGNIDKTIRIVLAIGIIAYGIIEQSLLGFVALVPLATAIFGWCPVYPILGISTCCKLND